jgi:hypothetical protein
MKNTWPEWKHIIRSCVSENNRSMLKAIILAGGKGIRPVPYNTIVPKPLMPVEDRPWEGYLTAELAARDCGWVKDGKLYCPDEPLVSPYKEVRYQG